MLDTPDKIAQFFGTSVENIKKQYAENAKILQIMHEKAVKTGKKVNGYTADQLQTLTKKYLDLAK